ncbi:phosphohistidine phosphatase SixA [Thalassolituus sp.]|uniref:phosphohistidine phosphatase SixA n=1 Tax=Thalassolituus sp. TaxID=2030822 RepID=UPI003519589D
MSVKLIIIRHGAAVAGADHDSERRLTPEGKVQAAHAAAWVAGRLPGARILSSPYRRAVQTAMEVARAQDSRIHETTDLTPDKAPSQIVDSLLDCQHDVVLVSHLPLVGRLAALLTDGQIYDQPWSTAECWLLEGDLIAPGCMQVASVWYPGLEY